MVEGMRYVTVRVFVSVCVSEFGYFIRVMRQLLCLVGGFVIGYV